MLLVIAVASIVAAVGFGWYAWRLRQEERRRSEARVASLADAIDAVEGASDEAWATHTPVSVPSLFALEHSAAAKGSPVIRLAVGVAMAVVLLVALAMNNRGATGATSTEGEVPRTVSSQSAALLELVAMRHERDGGALKVSGLVRNPRAGSKMTRVTAVVHVFNRAGAFVATGSAGLDFTTLDPGDESPFVVTIPGVADVARYRVSFRTEAGAVRHVDRRAEQMRLAASAGD